MKQRKYQLSDFYRYLLNEIMKIYKMKFIASVYLVLFSCFFVLDSAQTMHAQNRTQIDVSIENYQSDTLLLGYYAGPSRFVKDTVFAPHGKFSFQFDSTVLGGVYLFVLKPSNEIVEFILPSEDQVFALQFDAQNPVATMQVQGSEQNSRYFEHVRFLQEKRFQIKNIKSMIDSTNTDVTNAFWQDSLIKVDAIVINKLKRYLNDYPEDIGARLMNANLNMDFPDFVGTPEDIQAQRSYYFKKHYFDGSYLDDPQMLRTPFLYGKINTYLEKVVPPIGDSVINAVDFILKEMEPAPFTYEYYLVEFTNNYSASKTIGMDAVFVHLVDNYLSKGKAAWLSTKQLKELTDRADNLRKVLIGNTVPNLVLQTEDGLRTELNDVLGEYTVLYFFKPDCGHCKKSTPVIAGQVGKLKEMNVNVVTVCSKFGQDVPKCWEYLKTIDGADQMINLVDPAHRSGFMSKYQVTSTPKLFILDKDMRIVSKDVVPKYIIDVIEFDKSQSTLN